MKTDILKRIFFVAGLIVFCISCRNKNANGAQEAILKRPPFAELTDSIEKFPGNAGLFQRRADLLARNNLHEIASADFQQSWILNPTEESGWKYASNLRILNSMPELIHLLQECIKKFPSNNIFSRELGDIYAQGGQAEQALALYDDILKKDSTDFDTWYEKGMLLNERGDTAGAIEAVRRAWTLQPVRTYALQLANMYAEEKNPAALKICDEWLAKDTLHELTDPMLIKGIYYSNTGQYAAAMIQFDSCIRRDWKTTDAYIEKGIVLFRQKKFNDALPVFKMASTVSNTNPDAWFWMGRCYDTLGKKEEALLNYERARALNRNLTEADEAIKRLSGKN